MESNMLLKIDHITKEFPGVVAVDDVSFSIKKGEVHIIIGENGAGKSTLVKIIAGLHRQDKGKLYLEGSEFNPENVRDAQDKGVNMIHQELSLMLNQTVAQNICIGREPIKRKFFNVVDKKQMSQICEKLLNDLEIDISQNAIVKDLSIAQQQMIEVAKALSTKSKILIMDEPTSSLTKQEINNLFRITKKLKEEGVSIIYISHRMQELWEIGDRVTVMRDGKYIGTYDIKDIALDDLIPKMVGRKISNIYKRRYKEPGEEVLRIENLNGLRFRDIDIHIRSGEVVGLAGLIGAGRTELAKAIFGYDRIEGGAVVLFGNNIETKRLSPNKMIKNGVSLLPEDRKEEGLFISKNIKQNIVQAALNMLFKNKFINFKKETDVANQYIKQLRIMTDSPEKEVNNLSGGNQQKVVIAKWLCTQSKLFILDEPTRGIDIGAKAEIYELIDELVNQGAAVLMISSEQLEIIGICDRIYVLKDGEVEGMLDRKEHIINEQNIVSMAVGRGAGA